MTTGFSLEQRTQEYLVTDRSNTPLSRQIEETMFEPAKPKDCNFFDGKEHD